MLSILFTHKETLFVFFIVSDISNEKKLAFFFDTLFQDIDMGTNWKVFKEFSQWIQYIGW